MKIKDIYHYINEIAPFDTALSYDNCGILLGNPDREVTKCLICLDVTDAVLAEAVRTGAQLIVSHHPVIFHPVKRILADSLISRLLKENIAVLSAHTNLDMAERGVNRQLALRCGLIAETLRKIPADSAQQADGFGLAGNLPQSMMPSDFAAFVKRALGIQRIKYTDGKKEIRTVAVSCGAGGFLMDTVIQSGIDALVTAELKHHELLAAEAAGLTAVDAGHFETEQLIKEPLRQMLAERFGEIDFFCAGEEKNPACYL